ncbi:hypothetical protein F5Y17DRAFT_473487 [Xylariaceae sp. FL0594]|nr:hypothetical protein F5Y17DRAFT_473487 [Xylariaceae sp. FL0594]
MWHTVMVFPESALRGTPGPSWPLASPSSPSTSPSSSLSAPELARQMHADMGVQNSKEVSGRQTDQGVDCSWERRVEDARDLCDLKTEVLGQDTREGSLAPQPVEDLVPALTQTETEARGEVLGQQAAPEPHNQVWGQANHGGPSQLPLATGARQSHLGVEIGICQLAKTLAHPLTVPTAIDHPQRHILNRGQAVNGISLLLRAGEHVESQGSKQQQCLKRELEPDLPTEALPVSHKRVCLLRPTHHDISTSTHFQEALLYAPGGTIPTSSTATSAPFMTYMSVEPSAEASRPSSSSLSELESAEFADFGIEYHEGHEKRMTEEEEATEEEDMAKATETNGASFGGFDLHTVESPSTVNSSTQTDSSHNDASLGNSRVQTPTARMVSRGTQTDFDETHEAESLWKRELESIRRPEPLFKGKCITVGAPLKEYQSIAKRSEELEIVLLSDDELLEVPGPQETAPSRPGLRKSANRKTDVNRRVSTRRRTSNTNAGGITDAIPSIEGSGEMNPGANKIGGGEPADHPLSGTWDTAWDATPSSTLNGLESPRTEGRFIRDDAEDATFYGCTVRNSPCLTAQSLRYQDRYNNAGEIPGPKTGLRLRLDKYVRDSGCGSEKAKGLETQIKHVLKRTYFGSQTWDEEQAFMKHWKQEQSATLLKGFPLVEDVVFAALGNWGEPDGDCYWTALSYLLQGTRNRWRQVKADHLEYMYHVLLDKTHPRHELYENLNSQFFDTRGARLGHDGRHGTSAEFKANLWQTLQMPHSWTPGTMKQVTADLYNIHLVTFSYDSRNRLCTKVDVSGAYNSRHVFMLYRDDGHFQPLTPNEIRAEGGFEKGQEPEDAPLAQRQDEGGPAPSPAEPWL